MNRLVIIFAGAATGAAAWWAGRNTAAGEVVTDTVLGTVQDWGFNVVKVSNMRGLPSSLLNDANVRAMLRVIRTGEGTADAAGYNRLFGGRTFASYADHPRIVIPFGNTTTTAAGAYQFLSSTWDETRAMMGLRDFSPASQDMAAVGRIAARGALDDVLAGRLSKAIGRLNREWASLPGSPYGQPTMTLSKAASVYLAMGGQITEGTIV